MRCNRRAFSLIEVMISAVVLAVAIIGASMFRYHTMLDARKSLTQIQAGNSGVLILEYWRAARGDPDFDPTDMTEYTITGPLNGPAAPEGFTSIGSYKIVHDGSDFYATLSYQQMEDDGFAGKRLALNIQMVWPGRGTSAVSFETADKLLSLTTYAIRKEN